MRGALRVAELEGVLPAWSEFGWLVAVVCFFAARRAIALWFELAAGIRLDVRVLDGSAGVLLLSLLGPLVESSELPYTWHPVDRVRLVQAASASALGMLWLGHALHRLAASTSASWLTPRRLMALALPFALFYAALGIRSHTVLMTGDAPHYLLMTHSLLDDGDFDLADEFASEAYRAFLPGDRLMEPQVPTIDGRIYSHHLVGMSIVVAPFYALGGAPVAQLALNAIAGAGVALMLWLLADLFRWPSAVLGAGLFAFSFAWVIHANAFFAEALSAVLLLVFLLAQRGRLAAWCGYGALGALLWINLRFYLPVLLAAGWWMHDRRGWRDSGHRQGVGVLVALLFTVLLKNRIELGSWSPYAPFAYNGIPLRGLMNAGLYEWLVGLFGTAIDQEYGWLWYHPAFIPGTAGLFAATWIHRSRLWVPALCVGLYLGPTFGQPLWHGVMAPSRYVVFLLPLFVIGTIWYRERARPLWPLTALIGLQIGWSWCAAALPNIAFPLLGGRNALLIAMDDRLGGALAALTPSFLDPRPASWVWATGLSTIVGTLAYIHARQQAERA